MYDYKEYNIKNAKRLRCDMTEEERKLWNLCLRALPCKFYRQRAIGEYIVDFYCAERKTVIELDGSQHYEDKNHEADLLRDQYFVGLGIRVLRYSNYDINKNFKSVCEDIYNKLDL